MGKTVQLKARDGHSFDAYVAEPASNTKVRGAVVVVQEIFGVNSHIRGITDGFAADGYLAIAPALFDRVQRNYESGYSQPEVQAGRDVRGKVTNEQALADVQAAIDHVKGAGKVGVVGYCWGGTIAWLAASHASGISAAISYYGGGVPDAKGDKPKVPTMLHFGETDASIPVDKAKEVAAAHPDVPTYFYPAGHGFNCEQRGSYHEPSATKARERTLEFLRKHVG
jgi:carboxymethylenebutenolidase